MVEPVRLVRTVHDDLATGTSGNRRHDIGHRANLLQVSVGAGGTQPPIRAALLIGDFAGKLTPLADGWVRSPSSPGSSASLTWDGRISTPEEANWEVVLLWRNDTGATATVVFVHIEEDIP